MSRKLTVAGRSLVELQLVKRGTQKPLWLPLDRDISANAVSFARQARHFIQLAKTGEATTLFTVADDLEAMSAQAFDPVELLGHGSVEFKLPSKN